MLKSSSGLIEKNVFKSLVLNSNSGTAYIVHAA